MARNCLGRALRLRGQKRVPRPRPSRRRPEIDGCPCPTSPTSRRQAALQENHGLPSGPRPKPGARDPLEARAGVQNPGQGLGHEGSRPPPRRRIRVRRGPDAAPTSQPQRLPQMRSMAVGLPPAGHGPVPPPADPGHDPASTARPRPWPVPRCRPRPPRRWNSACRAASWHSAGRRGSHSCPRGIRDRAPPPPRRRGPCGRRASPNCGP